ncbi:TetR/AcrR family transcriptional regulator [Arthrobacter burdickii]|jgi:AcrR family transcriptional regulator|uniref:TetR/AcrR family transcriptional regulator n=1 Tax=Arthrobacter burdickii TaxID=3035920 RepID=A0ABT8K451_9MICC|nr:TetR/AcrR family transcriptional regulator [Arthrobacter burdickii]MDN4611566.1 TetR/AcrR family transcriptional regulator [Arthrobacter burdickii]
MSAFESVLVGSGSGSAGPGSKARVGPRSGADPAHPLIASHEAEVRLRVLKAASVLLDRLSYDAVTIDAVARASGVGKSTLYRYWPSRQLLVLEAFTYKTNLLTNVEDTGDVARDLHAYLVALTYCLHVGGAASTVANLLAEAIRSEDFAAQFRQTMLRERRQGFLAILQRGQRRGQVRDDVDLVMVIDAVYGSIHHRLVATGQDIDGSFLRNLTRFAIDGAASASYLASYHAQA